ncbi:hypothetical protein HT118_31470 [Escherichia coli]|nr:hypothetical protein [Escherichia coli]
MKEADMAEARRDAERSPQSRAPRQHGLLHNLVWGLAVGTGGADFILPAAESVD